MRYPRVGYKLIVVAVLANLCLGYASLAVGNPYQSSNPVSESRERGISLYNQGNDHGAIDALRIAVKQRKDDFQAWHYLGLALQRQGKTNDARKAHERAAKLGEDFIDRLLKSGGHQEFPQNLEKFKFQLTDAADSAQKFLELSSKPTTSKVEEWRARLELLRYYAELSALNDSGTATVKLYEPSQVSTRARIISKAEPRYTEEARAHKVSGTVILKGVLSSDGNIRAIRVVKGLPRGLNWMAIEAFRRIRFEPAKIGDTPVSQYIQIEYSFNLY